MNEQKAPFGVGDEVRFIGDYEPLYLNRKATITSTIEVSPDYAGAFVTFGDGGKEPNGWFSWKDLEAWQDADHTEHVHEAPPQEESDSWGKVIETFDLKTPAIQGVLDELRALSKQKLENAHKLSQIIVEQDQRIAHAEYNLQIAIHDFLAEGNQPSNYALFIEQSDCIEALSIVVEARQ